MNGLYLIAMGLHSQRSEQARRRKEPLGHIKLSLDDLERLISDWQNNCESITISIGDGMVADYVDDLADLSKADLGHLVIHTVNPTYAISLRRTRAEVTYIDDSSGGVLLSAIKYSLRPFKIKTPYYRLRVFWAWIYMLVLIVAGLLDYRFGSTPPKPPAGAPPQLPPPPPPVFSIPLFMIALFTLILLTAWFIYAYSRLDSQTSTRITTKKAKALEGIVLISDEPIEDE